MPLNEQMLFFVGYGSTLRNNKKFGDSQRILREGITKFPEHVALKIFLGFTLYAAGEHKEASKTLLTMAGQLPSDIVDGYGRAIGWNSKQLE